jgi:(p)ppGpp synthase/HD superfamily hydrolase
MLVAHDGQFRRDGITPYFRHPFRVGEKFSRKGDSEGAIVGFLHDILEDSKFTAQNLLDEGLNPNLVYTIELLTKKPGQDYFDYLKAIKANRLATEVKIADIIDNLSDDPKEKQMKKYVKALAFLLEI